MKLPFFLMVFVNVHIHFRIWTRIPRVTDPVPDPAKVPDPCGSRSGSGSTTLILQATILYNFTEIPVPVQRKGDADKNGSGSI
jgi:hypothetical protein